MKPITLQPYNPKFSQGFTLIELMVVLGILSIIGTIGLVVSFDFYRSYSFNSERDTLVSILQKARSQSLANINQAPHGVHFEDGKFVIFQGTYNAGNSTNQILESSPGIGHSASPTEIIFDQLSGDSNSGTITLTYNNKTSVITINSLGQIDW